MTIPRIPNDPHADAAAPRWQLRVLNGPARGTSHAVGTRLAIGRAASSDLQLVDQEVSRQHAHIVADQHGRHVLEDLDSRNGTYVDGKNVHRKVLRPHAVITIADTELLYEPAPAIAEPANGPERCTDAVTFRSTAEHAVVVARTHAPTTPVGAAIPPGTLLDRDGRALVFERPDGGEYEGNLVADILEYRTLRAQHLRGGFSDPCTTRAFERLRDKLQQPPSADRRLALRAFCRFGCWLPAHVRLASGEELSCHIRDVGVDGAQLMVTDHHMPSETIAWLMVEVIEAGERRAIALAGRVAWIDGEFLGLAFAGAPRRVDGRYAKQPTRREELGPAGTKEGGEAPASLTLRLAVDPGQG